MDRQYFYYFPSWVFMDACNKCADFNEDYLYLL